MKTPTPPRRILVVEDHDMNRDMITRRLSRLGYDVISAVNGEDAVASARKHAPDLILMDMGLPVMDGWTATRTIRAEETGTRTPIIALTAHVEQHDRTRALDAGCDEFETKPLDMPRLQRKMEALLTRKSHDLG